MEIRRVLPYIIGLVFLAFALGSLPRSQAGGSLLFQSYWLLYLIYLAPIAILGIMAALVVLITLNWRELSQGIGHGLARRRRTKSKPRSRTELIVYIIFWALALAILVNRQANGGGGKGADSIQRDIVGASTGVPNTIRIGSGIDVFSNFIQTGWFNIVFLALIVVCGFVLIQSVRVSFKESSTLQTLYPGHQAEGLQALEDAMKIVHDRALDPRSRIITCYEQLISAASRLGAPISSDQTARELEQKIRSMFTIKGDALHVLTGLFEIARYSMHEITENDASNAMQYLLSIYDELNAQIDNQL